MFKRHRINILLLALLIILVWYGSGLVMRRAFPDTAVSGQMGDMFGAVNALFSGLALAGVVVAIWFQSKELRLQREELEQTRAELIGQKEQLEAQKMVMSKQYDSMAIQQFENSFYQMLKTHNSLIGMMYDYTDDEYDESVVVGNALFEFVYNKMRRNFWNGHSLYSEQIMPYLFRVETMLSYIDSSEVKSKDMYIRVLRSNFTACEMRIIKMYEENNCGDFGEMFGLMYAYNFYNMLEYEDE